MSIFAIMDNYTKSDMDNELLNKLRVGASERKLILNKPDYVTQFDGLTFDTKIKVGKWDMIFSFIFSLPEFSSLLEKIITQEMLNEGGYIYFAYPKKANKRYKEYIGRDDFFNADKLSINMDNQGYVDQSDIKFAKMVAFDDTFTVIGLRRVKRKMSASSAPSQCVSDYQMRIPELRERLSPDIVSLFDALTPGYQRGWTRYVFSTKSEATTQKRLDDMAAILEKGYKSIDLYRQAKK